MGLRILAVYQAGTPSAALAAQFRIAKSSVLRILHERGKASHKRRGMSTERMPKAAQSSLGTTAKANASDNVLLTDDTSSNSLSSMPPATSEAEAGLT